MKKNKVRGIVETRAELLMGCIEPIIITRLSTKCRLVYSTLNSHLEFLIDRGFIIKYDYPRKLKNTKYHYRITPLGYKVLSDYLDVEKVLT